MTTPTTDARTAARTPRAVADLRPVEAAIRLCRDYGVLAPEALTAAHGAVRDARRLAAETRARVSDTLALADGVLDARDPSKAIAEAGKRLAVERAAVEVASSLNDAAVRRAVVALRETGDALVAAVLASPVLADAFADVEANLARVPFGVLAEPAQAEGLDTVAYAALLRRASARFEALHRALVSLDLLPAYGLEGAAVLLFADPAEIADVEELQRRMRGLRPGAPDMSAWQAGPGEAPAFRPLTAPGIPAALVAGLPGVTLRLAVSVEDFEARIARASSASIDEAALVFTDEDGERVTVL